MLDGQPCTADALLGVAHALSASLMVGLCSREDDAPIGWERVEDALVVEVVGGAGVAEPLHAEGEWVVGAHRAQHDVGPVMRERVVEFCDSVETPRILAVPS